jgi:hypothetical protein
VTVSPRPRALDWFVLASAGLHPTKVAILEVIAEGGNVAMSPVELAGERRVLATLVGGAKQPLGGVAYHVRELVEKGLLVLDRAEPRRGALQHFYVIPALALLSPAQQARRALSRSASRLAGREVALTADSFAEAMQAAAVRVGAAKSDWSSLREDEQMRMRRVAGELLAGVAGA